MTAWARMTEQTRRSSVRSGVEAGLADTDIADLLGAPVREVRKIIAEPAAIPEVVAALEPPVESTREAPASVIIAQPPPPRTWAVHQATRGEWPEERVEELKRLHAEGHSAAEIARRMGTGRNAIIGKLHRLGITSDGRPARPKPQTAVARTPAAQRVRPRAPKPEARPPTPPARVVPMRTDIPEPLSRMLPLLELDRQHCKWPSGADDPRDVTFCGAPRFQATPASAPLPYCEHHSARAYPPRVVRDRLDRRLATG